MNESDGVAKENSESLAARPLIMRKVSEIPEAIYGAKYEGKTYNFNPTAIDIQQAIDDGQFEVRGYQSHKDELEAEWVWGANESVDEYSRLQKDYHARRIACFVVHGWDDPIILAANGGMIDGSLRLKAAILKRMDEVEFRIAQSDFRFGCHQVGLSVCHFAW